VTQAKPYDIAMREVWTAYQRVRANGGAAGVDAQSIADFEKDLSGNLYKLWNRMSSGSYFPPPVRRVEIPKSGGGMRPLGIPTVADRIAQSVVKARLEPVLEELFHPDSYGYRPRRSAHQALATVRQRCWRYAWVVDVDIKGFFDNIDHSLMMRALRKHTDCPWMLLYIERWLQAPVASATGVLEKRSKGTPQGGVISPLLANLFLHYAFDAWMGRAYPALPFARYADDIVVHCRTLAEAEQYHAALTRRMTECGLELHPDKTRIVYCKQNARREDYPHVSFDFLGYTFRPRVTKGRGGAYFVGFNPALSRTARNSINTTIREWRILHNPTVTLAEIAQFINPVVRGWIHYYGKFFPSALRPALTHLDERLVKWTRRKYKRLRRSFKRARNWLRRIRCAEPQLFAHWAVLATGWTRRAV